ncbi:MAG TPA: cobalt-precorrin-5B (C(1))-methyltransferase CbiD, partial [Desulfuromonadaceae bacterium]
MRKPLRTGYTTGACAAAAAKGAALMLARQEPVNEVTILLPADVSATFALHGQAFAPDAAACYVIKDAGDDPDVTNGAEVHARVTVAPPPLMGGGRGEGEAARGNSDGDSSAPPTPALPHEGGGRIFISGGTGIGKATKPGLAVAPGEWAINPVPRRMIEQAVRAVFPKGTLGVEISIPDGEQRAQRTLNARLGIVGGLSILGTSGIVRPISAKAWTDTIDAALDVARACGCPTVVLSTGRTSELAAQRHLEYPPPLMGGGEGEG